MRVLILEDDYPLAEALALLLEREGIGVDITHSAEEAFEKTFATAYDLYLFDVNLIDDNGIEVLRQLQASGDTTPVIFISAMTDLETIQEAFDAGAVDYVKKPFEIEEVLIRVKSRMARQRFIVLDDIVYDPENRIVRHKGVKVELPPTLSGIFHKLVVNRNRVVHKEELLDLITNRSENALRVNVSKLKKRLGIDIKSVKNEGYLLG